MSTSASVGVDRAGAMPQMDRAQPSHGMGLSSGTGRVITAFLIVCALGIAAWGAGAFGAPSVQDAANGWLGEDGTWIAPASPAFRIWSVIYLGLLAYGIWQFLPSAQTARHDTLRVPVLVGIVLNSLWLLVIHLPGLIYSVIVMLALLTTLCWIMVRLERRRHSSWSERIILDGVQGLYLGWVSVATIANIAAWLGQLGWAGAPFLPPTWAIIMIVVATVVAALTAVYNGGRIGPSIATAWGLAWIGIARSDGTGLQSGSVAVTAFGAAGVVMLCWAASLWLSYRSPTGEARDIIFGDADASAAGDQPRPAGSSA
ncbi:MAG: tryptophan-rich sensory protein [Micrococcus sp.]|nr:tryptophan-rich sensory protein [Micrococcus sp.]